MRAARFAFVVAFASACGGHKTPAPDGMPAVTTELCNYQPMTPTANAGTAVAAGALQAGAAERVLDVPVGTALGGYTARAGLLGAAGVVDARKVDISGTFNPSIGRLAAPRAKAVALSAGGETVVLVNIDMVFVYEGMLFDLEQKLGPQFAGKVILSASHSHSAWAQFTGHGPLKLGSGEFRQLVYDRMLAGAVGAAQDAIAAMQPAQIGFFYDDNFDPTDQITRDRRAENDNLPGGHRKDDHFFMIRLDTVGGAPIAAIPIFGMHGTLEDETNPLASTDAPGALERAFEEQFSSQMVVMRLQSAGGDVSPVGHGAIDCAVKPGAAGDPCLPWAVEEGHGRAAVTTMMAAYEGAGTAMVTSLPLSMLSRSIDTGPDPTTFTIRGGALAYAPFDLGKTPDGQVYDDTGAIISPIDEYDAPVGAALCETGEPMFPAAAIPGTETILPYGSCLRLDVAGSILGPIFNIDFGVDETHPVCESTRSTISALRVGDYVIGTIPGELSVLLKDYLIAGSPVAADHTILVGYAQGHGGYMLRPEDWLLGGYEPSVSFWGPLEAEMVAEKLLALMPLALSDTRQDGTVDGTTKLATVTTTDTFAIDDPAPMAGTIPATVPAGIWMRTGTPAQAQPAATIPRVSGIATFVWIGDDPSAQTPHVTLQFETTPGTYTAVTRHSGRIVDDAELAVAYTPAPLQRTSGPQTHYWTVEWQAVPWLGEDGVDTLDDRGGLPLGNYRFHVDGKGWSIDSQPFAVVAGGLEAIGARVAGNVQTNVSWHAPKGWRLMDMTLNSNDPVPLRSQAVTVALLDAGGSTLISSAGTTDANGAVTVPDHASSAMVKVTDRFGNVATAPIN